MCKCLNCGIELEGYQKKFCSYKCQGIYTSKLKQEEYFKNPNKCTNCGCVLPFEKKNNKFCSSSCSVSYSNSNRELSQTHKDNISKQLNCLYKERQNFCENTKSKNAIRTCKVCGKQYTINEAEGSTRKVCSKECRQYYLKHRNEFLSDDAKQKIAEGQKKSIQIQSENRRSKNEKYFCELCENHFKQVRHNEPLFNGWDADIIIEDIKYAVLWNGIWHYKKIYEDYNLNQTETRDKIKIQEIIKCGYTPYIIKDMGKANKRFVEKEFEKFILSLKE